MKSKCGESCSCASSPWRLPRGWAAAAALSPTEGVLFGGLSGNDDAPVRLDDAWLLSVEEPMAYSRMV